MPLADVCEPLFKYVCSLNRAGRNGADVPYEHARAEVQRLLAEIASAAGEDPRMAGAHEKIDDCLLFFVDDIVCNSKLNMASQWRMNQLAFEKGEMAGGEKFFTILDDLLKDRGEDAIQALRVLYTCIGLGFTGVHFNDTNLLYRRMVEIADRLGVGRELDLGSRICPDAYEHLDTRILTEPPTRSLFGIGIVFVGAVCVLFATNLYLFKESSQGLSNALERIGAYALGSPAAPPSEAVSEDGASAAHEDGDGGSETEDEEE